MRRGARIASGVCLVLLCGVRVAAQAAAAPTPSAADVAISQGRLGDAEQALFAASSRATHEPSARGALGMFLASRGRLKVGAVLLEEAREFGGDAAVIDARLARIYAWLGDWASVAALKHYAGPGPEYDRVRWLAGHEPAHSGADSAVVALEPNEIAGLGRVGITIGRTTLQADINPDVEGLLLPSNSDVTGDAQQFGMRDSTSVAVVFDVAIGAIHLANVPARLSPAARPVIGLDVLAALTPTFDAPARLLTLRQRAASVPGDPFPVLLSFPGVRLVSRAGQPPVAIESAAGRAALRGARWTLDLRRGAIVSER